jgi:serine protease AprX
MNTPKEQFIAWRMVAMGLTAALVIFTPGACLAAGSEQPIPPDTFNNFNIDAATLDDVISTFGEPEKYVWGRDEFQRDDLPAQYVAVYPRGFQVCLADGRVVELRHEGDDGYLFAGKLKVGSTLDEVLAVLGQPRKTIVGEAFGWQDDILYKDAEGKKGYCYYAKGSRRVRMFFIDYKVTALYVTRSDNSAGEGPAVGVVTKIESVDEFDDVRWKDLSDLDLSTRTGLVATLEFNAATVWPKKLPPGEDPKKILAAAMNPGLGVRKLHNEGITGEGVNVAIIDQPLYQDHPEFAGKIAKYFDVGCGSENSMHGPAVASLLVGTRCGTAPGARLYYVAAPSWLADAAYYAKAMDWIVEQNASLPPAQKIRAVSVSASPSGQGSPFKKNQDAWDDACRRANDAGILVLDCTMGKGFIGPCQYDLNTPDSLTRCKAGYAGRPVFGADTHVLAPCSIRTTAEHFIRDKPSYAYWGQGGLSWSIPYATGVLAMGWQLAPELSGEEMKQLLFDSAYVDANGAKFINPPKFIELVRQKHQAATR